MQGVEGDGHPGGVDQPERGIGREVAIGQRRKSGDQAGEGSAKKHDELLPGRGVEFAGVLGGSGEGNEDRAGAAIAEEPHRKPVTRFVESGEDDHGEGGLQRLFAAEKEDEESDGAQQEDDPAEVVEGAGAHRDQGPVAG